MDHLFFSTDPRACQDAYLLPTEERKRDRVKFKPAVLVDEIRAKDPSRKRQAWQELPSPYLLRMMRIDKKTCAVSPPRNREISAKGESSREIAT